MPWRLALLLTGVSALAHAMLAFGTEWVPDEAYYALWSRHLAWDYPDHPPGVAALLVLGRGLFGEGTAGVRGPALLVAVVVPLLLAWAVARTRSTEEARRLLWLLHATVLLHALGVIATPDTPLTLAWALALAGLLWLHGGAEAPVRRWRWAILCGVGIAIGLALLSKLTGWALLAGVLLAAATGRSLRERMGGWGGLAGVTALALAVAAPWGWAVLSAPADSDLAFQLARLEPRGSWVGNLGGYLGGQVGLLTPGIFWLVILWGRSGLIRARVGQGRDPRDALLLWLCGPLVLAFLLLSLLRPVEANWVGPAWLAALVGASGVWVSRRTFTLSVGSGLFLVLLAHALALGAAHPAAPGLLRRGALGRLGGWAALSRELDDACPEGVIRVRDYGAGAQLTVSLGAERVRVETPGRASAFDRWTRPEFQEETGACELHSCRQPPPPPASADCRWQRVSRPEDAAQARYCLASLRCPPPPPEGGQVR